VKSLVPRKDAAMQRLLFLFIISLSFFHNSFAASFDCSKATRSQDKMVCSTPALSAADTQLTVLYKSALAETSDPTALRKAQEAWLATRNTCSDPACLLQAYQTRIAMLQKISAITPASSVSISSPATTSAINMVSNVAAITPRNADGTYPVWVSPDLGVKSLSIKDIDAALERKFWDSPVIFQQDYIDEVKSLKLNKNDKHAPVSCNAIEQLIFDKKIVNDAKHNCAFLYPADGLPKSDPVRKYPYGFLPQPWAYCGAINLLKQVRPAKQSMVNNFKLNQNLTKFMPALLVPENVSYIDDIDKSQKDPLLLPENQKKTWQEYYVRLFDKMNFLNVRPTHVRMEFKDDVSGRVYAITDLIILARGDFIGDGTEQLLMSNRVYKSSNDLAGSGSSVALYLLRRNEKNQPLEVLYPENYFFSHCDIRLSNR
jgi:uncharacterized protein